MKKILYMAMSLLLATGFVACGDNLEVGEVDLGYLKLVESNVDFDFHGGSGKIVVDTQSPVTATMAADGVWASASVDGNTVTVTVPEYLELQTRNTSVTLVSGNRSVVVPISQTAYAIVMGTNSLTYPAAGGTQTVSISPKDIFSIVGTISAPWVRATISNETDILTVTADVNSGGPRSATVTVVSGVSTATVTINQASALSVSSPTLNFAAAGGYQTTAFALAGGAAGVVVSGTSNETWANVSVNSSARVATVTVSDNVTMEDRTATITLTATGGASTTITVNQEPLDASTLSWEIWANGSYRGAAAGNFGIPAGAKTTTLSKAKGINVFRIDSPYVTGYHFMFGWDIDTRATSITPIPQFTMDGFPVQDTGVIMEDTGNNLWDAMWVTDPDTYYTYYTPAQRRFTINSIFGAFQDTNYGGYILNWSNDTFTISEFLKGDPWQ